jgi:hypothetical protein
MRLRILASVLVRALPVVGPFLRRLDRVEVLALMAIAEADLARAQIRQLRAEAGRKDMSRGTCGGPVTI